MIDQRKSATAHWIRVVVSALLLICILIIVAAPAIDLPQTALRTQHIGCRGAVHATVLMLTFPSSFASRLIRCAFGISPDAFSSSRSHRLSISCLLLC